MPATTQRRSEYFCTPAGPRLPSSPQTPQLCLPLRYPPLDCCRIPLLSLETQPPGQTRRGVVCVTWISGSRVALFCKAEGSFSGLPPPAAVGLKVPSWSPLTEQRITSSMMKLPFPASSSSVPAECPCLKATLDQSGGCNEGSGKRKFKYVQRRAS